jgi:small subunit ribosomal protein S1
MAKKHRFLEQLGGDPFVDEDASEEGQFAGNEFADMIAQEAARGFATLRQGDKIEAKVVGVVDGSIVFDVGQRSEGILPTDALSHEEIAKYKVGETYSLYVSSVRNGIELATSVSSRHAGLDSLRDAMNAGLPVEGKVSGENKGGYTVEIAGARAFCPFSQIDVVSGKPAAAFIGQTFRFKIIKVAGRDVVLSRSALLREEQAGERAKVLEKLQVGETVLATVVKLESFGAFVDIGGGLNALVPMSELSWSRPSSAHAVCNVGDKVTVKILKIDTTGDRPKVSASMKQVEGDPWDVTVEKLETGSIVDVKITRLMQFGAFAEILPGVEGLIHISEMSAKKRVNTPGEIVESGQTVKAKITGIDRIQKRIGLSMKVLDADYVEQEGKKRIEREKASEDEHRGVEFHSKGSSATLGDAFLKAANKAKSGK